MNKIFFGTLALIALTLCISSCGSPENDVRTEQTVSAEQTAVLTMTKQSVSAQTEETVLTAEKSNIEQTEMTAVATTFLEKSVVQPQAETILTTEKSNVEQTETTIKATASSEQSAAQTQTETTVTASPKAAVTQTNKLSEHIEITATMADETVELYKVPEVVFIFSHEYYTPNCFGFYITNEGLIKSFDFREISPDAYCYVGDIDVYSTLDDIGIDTDFAPVSKETLSELFELLLNIADDNEYECHSDNPWSNLEANGHYNFFAARFSESNDIQIISLGEYGDFNGENSDVNANELFNKLKLLFPDPHEYLY